MLVFSFPPSVQNIHHIHQSAQGIFRTVSKRNAFLAAANSFIFLIESKKCILAAHLHFLNGAICLKTTRLFLKNEVFSTDCGEPEIWPTCQKI